MKYSSKNILLVVCCAGLALAQPKGSAAPAAPAKSAAPSKPGPSGGPYTVPKDAVEVEPGIFEAKDGEGKVWHYARTPFGVRRFEPQPKRDDTTAIEAAGLIVTGQEDGVVRFERKTPFGVSKWSKKKDRLTAAEKMAVEQAASRKTSRGPAAAATATTAATAKAASKQ